MDLAPGLGPGRGRGRRAESARHRHGACPSSGFHQRFDAIAVEAFTRSQGFGREAAMDGRFNAQHKLKRVKPEVSRCGPLIVIAVNWINLGAEAALFLLPRFKNQFAHAA